MCLQVGKIRIKFNSIEFTLLDLIYDIYIVIHVYCILLMSLKRYYMSMKHFIQINCVLLLLENIISFFIKRFGEIKSLQTLNILCEQQIDGQRLCYISIMCIV